MFALVFSDKKFMSSKLVIRIAYEKIIKTQTLEPILKYFELMGGKMFDNYHTKSW